MNDIYLPVKDIPPEIIAAAKVLYNWTEMHNVEAFGGFVSSISKSCPDHHSEVWHHMDIDSIAKLAFTNARNKALNANLSVLETDNGVLYEVFPNGNRIEVKKVPSPIKVKKGGKINIDTSF